MNGVNLDNIRNYIHKDRFCKLQLVEKYEYFIAWELLVNIVNVLK